MLTDLNTPLPDTPFWRAYDERFQGVLTWSDFDTLWARLENGETPWFVYELDGPAPDAPVDTRTFRAVLDEARDMYEPARSQSYCGAVYVDDKAKPAFVKVFDPYRMGAVCGTSGERTLPRWTFSLLRPDPIPAKPDLPSKKGLFARFSMR